MRLQLWILAFAALALAGCGGGGDADSAEARPSKEDAGRQMDPPEVELEVIENPAAGGQVAEAPDALQETPEKPGRAMRKADEGGADGANASSTSSIDTSALKAAPAWTLPNLEGEAVRSSDFTGKVVIFDFWATWCGPCRMEIPHFIDLQNTYGEHGLEIVGVAMDQQGAMIVAPFVEKNGVNYHTVIGTAEVAQAYGPIRGIPTTFVITQDGKIYKKYVGYRPKEVFEADVRALLGMS